MAIPPFPPQDLAKLVLGYLAEEQLMTAYDEFLQASPYLDVLKNEFDRILMTSLKNILAEYRAVKIYVESCKPLLLRRKLCQCSNLLEIFKYLVKNVDINRIQAQELINNSVRYSKHVSQSKSSHCDICSSLSLSNCMCKIKGSRLVSKVSQDSCHIEGSFETTSLADLPGNAATNRKSTVYPEVTLSQTSSTDCITDTSNKTQSIFSTASAEAMQISSVQNNITHTSNTNEILAKSDESRQKIEEFNTILNLVCNSNSECISRSSTDTQTSTSKSVCNAGTFQEFATGVIGTGDKEKLIVPDSSTSENLNTAPVSIKERTINITPITSLKGPNQYLFKVGTGNSVNISDNVSNVSKNVSYTNTKEKTEDSSKITILSDVKFDNSLKNNKLKMPTALKPFTPTPLLQMQTIVINGTPAYKQNPQTVNFSFTKDEIMAMPTIFVVPSSGATTSSSVNCSQNNMTQTTSTMTTTTNTTQLLGPLVIDVTSNDGVPTSNTESMPELVSQDAKKVFSEGLIKTVDLTTHASLPKDSNHTVSHKTSTPNALPPTRKSSSTPRRNSHVRVLDFATPRRILHETISEEVKDPNVVIPAESTTDIIKPDVPVHTNIIKDNSYVSDKFKSSNKSKNVSNNQSKVKAVKKHNWDAELRALALGKSYDQSLILNELNVAKELPISIEKRKKARKKKTSPVTENDKDTQKAENDKQSSVKVKKSKKRKKSIEVVIEHVKEEIKILECDTVNLTECDKNTQELEKIDKGEPKSNISDERIDTPEADRILLQNAIGARLNISDFLETPYKQVFYDIQMETPKFLGPDLPDEPISDIKIMNIPTPRFLNTPKPLQATPSSYSSRPTDYSSGGSYYKPDDQDYVPSSEVLQCADSNVENTSKSASEDMSVVVLTDESKEKEKSAKSNRPQRKCTRNVSYRSATCCQGKEHEALESASVSSETSNKSSRDKKPNKSAQSKPRLKPKPKVDKILNKSIVKKETPKKFMKIKPRRPTPVKESLGRGRKITHDLSELITLKSSRKRTTSKDKNMVKTPIVAPAPTKSRRKSSTPRKLHCTKTFTPDNVNKNSSDLLKTDKNVVKETNTYCIQDSDKCSQETKAKEDHPTKSSVPEEEDIVKIKNYIETTVQPKEPVENCEGSLHNDLIQRGFDAATAKIIERDLLDATPVQDTAIQSTNIEHTSVNKPEVSVTITQNVETSASSLNNEQIDEEEIEIEDVELSVHDCNEGSKNFVTYQFDETEFVPNNSISKLKDKFSMELCIEDDVTIRLRATEFKCCFDLDPDDYNRKETEAAVSSIADMDKLYTPLKDHRKQYYEIFDSTLTSIDTPLKTDARKKEADNDTTVTEIVLEVENIEVKEKAESKKRKRAQSVNMDDSSNKKVKPETEYLLHTANIQNIDIESVLSKLHGP